MSRPAQSSAQGETGAPCSVADPERRSERRETKERTDQKSHIRPPDFVFQFEDLIPRFFILSPRKDFCFGFLPRMSIRPTFISPSAHQCSGYLILRPLKFFNPAA